MKQYWINPHSKTAYESPDGVGFAVHVIEYSEYQKLLNQYTKAVDALKDVAEYRNTDDVNGEAGEIAYNVLREVLK